MQPEFNFRWFKDGEDRQIPAAMLASALRSAQEAFHLAGLLIESGEQVADRQRARIPADIARRYVLHCLPAVSGSYDVPTLLGERELVDETYLQTAADMFESAVEFGSGDNFAFRAPLPPSRIARAFVSAVGGIAPPRGSGWSLEVREAATPGRGGSTHTLTDAAHRRLEDLARSLERGPTIERGTVTGELRAINFAQKQITILYPVDDRELVCSYSYDDGVEPMLIDQRLAPVHVTGRIIRDAHGRITSIDEVDAIEPLDTSSFEVGRIELSEGASLRPIVPLRLDPTQDEASGQLLSVDYVPLGLLTVAPSRSALIDAVRDEIEFLWEQYAQAEVTALSAGALELRRALLDHFEEVR